MTNWTYPILYVNTSGIAMFQARNYIQSLPALKRRDFREVFRGANPLAVNLLELMLELDADKWVTHSCIRKLNSNALFININKVPTTACNSGAVSKYRYKVVSKL